MFGSYELAALNLSLILSAFAVAGSLGAILVTYRLGVRRFDHERALADRADARTILAQAAAEVHRSTAALNAVWLHIEAAPMARDEDPPNAAELIDSAASCGRELEKRLAAVRVRFKLTDPVAKYLADAVDAMMGLVQAYRRRHSGRKDTGSLEKRENKVLELRTAFNDASSHFYEAAQDVAGAHL